MTGSNKLDRHRKGVTTADAKAKLSFLPESITVECLSLTSLKGTLKRLAKPGSWLAAFSPDDYYGPNYLLDMALATRFSVAPMIGKAAHYQADSQGIQLQHTDQAYRAEVELPLRAAVLAPRMQVGRACAWIEGIESATYTAANQQALDAFNYCRGGMSEQAEGNSEAFEALQVRVDDAEFDTGIPLAKLEQLAKTTVPATNSTELIPSFSPSELNEIFSNPGTATSNMTLTKEGLKVTSKLRDGIHEYIYIKEGNNLTLKELGKNNIKDGKLPLHLEIKPGLNLTLVIIFFDAKGKRLHHYIVQANKNNLLDIPKGSEFVRLGFRVYQGGECTVKRLLVGEKDLSPEKLLGRSNVLLVTNHYPSYDDLYRNGFVHSRVKSYKEYNIEVDVFRFRKGQAVSWHEFQDVDVITGSSIALRRILEKENHHHVLVHFLDADMWDVLGDFIDDIKVTVWVHGADIQPWYRRKFNIETSKKEKIAKEISKHRMAFWRSILSHMHKNLQLVFVSNYFAEEVMEDLGFRLPKNQYSIIHNPINTSLFSYQEKNPELRKKILSIRPYASRVYANDLMVNCILELSNEPFFDELEFRIIGDGKLFDETVEPVKKFKNVIIEKKFLRQQEIAELHKQYGVFLCPSRMDTQGVSRDEAMSSGLVPITTRVGAIPEFLDENSGFMAESEDYESLATSIIELYNKPEKFNKMSKSGRERIEKKVSKNILSPKEIKLFY